MNLKITRGPCWNAAFEGLGWGLGRGLGICISNELPLMSYCCSLDHTLFSQCIGYLSEWKETFNGEYKKTCVRMHALALWAHKILNLWCQTKYKQVVPGIRPASMSDRQCCSLPASSLAEEPNAHFCLAKIWIFFSPPYFVPVHALQVSFLLTNNSMFSKELLKKKTVTGRELS